jgi:hypothetical protein
LWKNVWEKIFVNNHYLKYNTIEYKDGYPIKIREKYSYYANCKCIYKLIKLKKILRPKDTILEMYNSKEICICNSNLKSIPTELNLLDNLQVLCLTKTQLQMPINPNNFTSLITRFSENTHHNPYHGCTGSPGEHEKDLRHRTHLNFK